MTGLADPATLLAAWDEATGAPPAARGAVLVHHAGFAPDVDAALDLPLAECAERARRVHVEDFEATVSGVACCRGCGEPVEIAVHLPDLVAADAVPPPGARPLTTRDLLDAATAPDPAAALRGRCGCREADAERLAGLAAIVLRACCPGCGGDVALGLDIAALLWDQVDTTATAMLDEVAALATAYGWTERDVLALPASRRRRYRERIGS